LVQITSEKVKTIKSKMKTYQDRHKSYANVKRKPLGFNVGDMMYLKVAPWKHMLRFGMKGKLVSRYIGPLEVVKRIGPVAYKLALPPHLAKIHDAFHVSLLQKANTNPSEVLPQVPLEINEDLTMEVKPVKILDQSKKELRSKKIPMVKVLWKSSQVEDEPWERESKMKEKHLELFLKTSMEIQILRTKFS